MNSQRLNRHKPENPAAEWFATCKTPEEKEELRQFLGNSNRLFDLLKNMIQKRYDAEVGVKDTDYDTAAWSHKQAHRNGRLAAFEEVYKLLP
jgi:hypothetical protein